LPKGIENLEEFFESCKINKDKVVLHAGLLPSSFSKVSKGQSID
jgi:hypothetical protein